MQGILRGTLPMFMEQSFQNKAALFLSVKVSFLPTRWPWRSRIHLCLKIARYCHSVALSATASFICTFSFLAIHPDHGRLVVLGVFALTQWETPRYLSTGGKTLRPPWMVSDNMYFGNLVLYPGNPSGIAGLNIAWCGSASSTSGHWLPLVPMSCLFVTHRSL